MPSKPPRPCKKPMCSGLTTDKHGYCEKHAHLYKPWSTGSAGKGRGGRPWRRQRERVFKRDNFLCQIHLERGELKPVELHGPNAGICDHKDPLSVTGQRQAEDDDLQTICQECDRLKTQQESRAGS